MIIIIIIIIIHTAKDILLTQCDHCSLERPTLFIKSNSKLNFNLSHFKGQRSLRNACTCHKDGTVMCSFQLTRSRSSNTYLVTTCRCNSLCQSDRGREGDRVRALKSSFNELCSICVKTKTKHYEKKRKKKEHTY